MAEDRMLRASMRTSEKVNSWPIPLRYFWSQLWGYCDSWGRGLRDSRLVVAGTFPMDEEVDAKTVERWLKALETAGVIVPYEVGGKRYFECVNWDEHQDIRYRKKTNIPDRSGIIPGSAKSSGKFRKGSHQGEGEVEGEVEGEGESLATPFCSKHPEGTDTPCIGCRSARLKFEAELLAAKNKPTTPGIVTDPDCPKHPNRPARDCDRCAEEAGAA